jgi:branched-chain amino acid transport system ATP-binding protein
MTNDVILSFEDVRLAFAGVVAIDGVSFTVGRDELFAIIGPNGAGKTSIFNVLSGVYRPQRGRVVFDGQDILGRRPHQIAAAGLARTFQNVELFANLTVLDNLMLGLHTHLSYGTFSAIAWFGRARRQEVAARAEVERIVDFLELEQWRRMPVGLLPYGVQKRVELGRALAMRPKLLLLDEPVAGMNLEETEDMARFILDIREELKIPIILVEHDMGLVMDLADRVMVVEFGRPVATGTPAEIQHHPEVLRAYLGTAGRAGETAPETPDTHETPTTRGTPATPETATVGDGARGTESGGGA